MSHHDEETTLLEAYAIMAGSTRRLPTVAHLLALRNAHEKDLRRMLDIVSGPSVHTDVRLTQEESR